MTTAKCKYRATKKFALCNKKTDIMIYLIKLLVLIIYYDRSLLIFYKYFHNLDYPII